MINTILNFIRPVNLSKYIDEYILYRYRAIGRRDIRHVIRHIKNDFLNNNYTIMKRDYILGNTEYFYMNMATNERDSFWDKYLTSLMIIINEEKTGYYHIQVVERVSSIPEERIVKDGVVFVNAVEEDYEEYVPYETSFYVNRRQLIKIVKHFCDKTAIIFTVGAS